MNRLAAWFQITSNFAVLLGLLFVGVQLYQDREFKRIELLDQGWLLNIERSRDLMGEDMAETLAKSALRPDDLTDDEHYKLIIYFDAVFSQRRRNAMLESAGMRPEKWMRVDLPGSFRTEAGKTYVKRILSNPEPESADWALSKELRNAWAAQIQEDDFTNGLRSLIETASQGDTVELTAEDEGRE